MGELEKRPEGLVRPGQVYRPEPIVPRDIWVDREVEPVTGRVIEVHHHYHAPDPAPERRETVADRFTPHFVIMMYAIVILGGLGIIGYLLLPPFAAFMVTLTASLVSIMATAVSVLIVLAVITWIVRGMISDSREHDRNGSE